MQKIETLLFQWQDKDYEIRIVFDGSSLVVRAYHDGKPANGFSYRVDMTTASDLKKLIGLESIGELIKPARDDVIENRVGLPPGGNENCRKAGGPILLNSNEICCQMRNPETTQLL